MKKLKNGDFKLECGCLLHEFSFGGFVEKEVIKRCGKSKKECNIEILIEDAWTNER